MNQKSTTITIDATDRPIGRLATDVASRLRGKDNPAFVPYRDSGVTVIIQHIDRVKVTEKKLSQNRVWRNTGYPGGTRSRRWGDIAAKGPDALFLSVIKHMLPNNKLGQAMLKRIKFERDR